MKIKLNKIQRQAVEENEGPVLVFAGAGSGKTKVLTEKIHRLIEIEKFKPKNILSVTFTNKAAKEMKTRVMSLLKTEKLEISIGTFHSICARLIRNEAKNIGLNPQFAIYDVQDQLDLYKIVLSSYQTKYGAFCFGLLVLFYPLKNPYLLRVYLVVPNK